MEALKDTPVLKHNPDTLEAVRKEFNLHQPGRMEESIDRLREWVAAQPHFKKKDFNREYLEAIIIKAKGSVEGAKGLLEKLCAYKTFVPYYFLCSTRPIEFKGLENIDGFVLPRLTKDNYRVMFLRNMAQRDHTVPEILNYVIKNHFMLEYLLRHSYASGSRLILDYRETDLTYLLSAIKYPEARNSFGPFYKGYAPRIKSVHILSTSKLIDFLVAAVRQVINIKLLGRIYVHSNVEELYEHFDKDILPSEYGGKEKSVKELKDDWEREISSNEFMEYIKDMFQATIDPSLKPIDKFDDLLVGSGTFRTLSID